MKTCKIHVQGDDVDYFAEMPILHAGAHFVVTYDFVKSNGGYTVTHLRTGYCIDRGMKKKVAIEMCDAWNELFTAFRFDASDRTVVQEFHRAIGILNSDITRVHGLLKRKMVGKIVNLNSGVCVRAERAKSTYGVDGMGDAY